MEFLGFEWDDGNRAKCQKHGVSIETIEALFLHPVAILPDEAHSQTERRFRAVGRTAEGRGVFIVFTLRQRADGVLIRPISARYMRTDEVKKYEKENPSV